MAMTGSATFVINVPKMGLFAHLGWVLLGLRWADHRGYRIHFECTNPQYNATGQCDDWLSPVITQSAAKQKPVFKISDYHELPFAHQTSRLNRTEARDIVQRHLAVATDILKACDTWSASIFTGRFVMGVHYRGTDKISEAPPVAHADVYAALNQALQWIAPQLDRMPVVFVATDNSDFAAGAKHALPLAEVHVLDDVRRSATEVGVHNLGRDDGPRLAREAMMDAVLLSRCHLLLKTASALSGWSTLLGRDMPVVLLNPPYAYAQFFPDNILVTEVFSRDQVLPAVSQAFTAWTELERPGAR
jgi:hypothetical protein